MPSVLWLARPGPKQSKAKERRAGARNEKGTVRTCGSAACHPSIPPIGLDWTPMVEQSCTPRDARTMQMHRCTYCHHHHHGTKPCIISRGILHGRMCMQIHVLYKPRPRARITYLHGAHIPHLYVRVYMYKYMCAARHSTHTVQCLLWVGVVNGELMGDTQRYVGTTLDRSPCELKCCMPGALHAQQQAETMTMMIVMRWICPSEWRQQGRTIQQMRCDPMPSCCMQLVVV
jgi:hypothetical protein